MAVHAIASSHAALASHHRCYCYLKRLGDPAEDGHELCADYVFQSPARQLSIAQRSSWNKTIDDHVGVSDPRATTVPFITNRYTPKATDSPRLRQHQQHDFIDFTVMTSQATQLWLLRKQSSDCRWRRGALPCRFESSQYERVCGWLLAFFKHDTTAVT